MGYIEVNKEALEESSRSLLAMGEEAKNDWEEFSKKVKEILSKPSTPEEVAADKAFVLNLKKLVANSLASSHTQNATCIPNENSSKEEYSEGKIL